MGKNYFRILAAALCLMFSVVMGFAADTVHAAEEEELTFSKESGCYDSGFPLAISGEGITKILYTLDGSIPAEGNSSTKTYSGEFNLTNPKGTEAVLTTYGNSAEFTNEEGGGHVPSGDRLDRAAIVRAVGVREDGTKTKVSTRTYFIGNNIASMYNKCAVISLVTDKDNLLNDERGIYVLGSKYKTSGSIEDANFMQKGKDWERAASMEFFDENGNMAVSRGVGIRIHGGYSRRDQQKSFNIYFRNDYDYGTKNLKGYELIPGAVRTYDNTNGAVSVPLKDYANVMLRNGGNDSNETKFQDVFIQGMVGDRAFTTQAARPCMLYLNGEYWGLYNLTEKYSDKYLQEKFDVEKSNVIVYKNLELDEGEDEGGAALAELKALGDLDMSKQENYDKFLALVDEKSFIDYYATEIYINNNDWWSGCSTSTPHNNLMFWKVANTALENADNPYADGKWRYMLFDTEWSMGLYGSREAGAEYDSLKYHALGIPDPGFGNDAGRTEPNGSPLFTALLKNDTFREKFVNTMLDLRNWNFEPNRCSKVLDGLAGLYRPLMDKNRERWNNWGNVDSRTENLKNFLNVRSNYILTMLESDISGLNNSDRVNVTVSNNAKLSDSVSINSITPNTSAGWKGVYYKNCPITLKAESRPGHDFDHWSVTDGTTAAYVDSEITLTLHSADVRIQAVYEGEEEAGDSLESNQYYVAEFEVPFENTRKAGDEIGAEVQINDCGKSVRYGTLNMFAQSSPYDSGTQFGKLVLSEENSDTVITDKKLNIIKTDTDIQVDGKIDEAWQRAQYVNLEIYQPIDGGEKHCDAKAKFMWTSEKLYILVYVKDPDICYNSKNYESDSVEIFYDGDAENPAEYAADMFQYRILHNGIAEGGKGSPGSYDVNADVKIYDGSMNNGYVVEYKVPFKTAKQAGDKVSFELQIADAVSDVDGRIGKLNLFAVQSPYSNRSEFGTAVLVDSYQGNAGFDVSSRQMYGIKTDTPIVADGKIDEAWQKATPYTIDKYTSKNVSLNGEICEQSIGATARVMWDEDNFYVLVIVADSDLKQNSSYSESDCVELFFDEDITATEYVTAFQYRIAFDGTTEAGNNYEKVDYNVAAGAREAEKPVQPLPTTAPSAPPVTAEYVGTFVAEHATITTYNRQDYEDASNMFTEQTQASARNADTGEPDTSGNGQINFTVVPEAGYAVEDVQAVPVRNFKNLKKPDETGRDNTYRITKIKGDITITVTMVRVGTVTTPEPSAAPSKNPVETTAPSAEPSTAPSTEPSAAPSKNPAETTAPSTEPSAAPSKNPVETTAPSIEPSAAPSKNPAETTKPSAEPSTEPSKNPAETTAPSAAPSTAPSKNPAETTAPSTEPSTEPSKNPAETTAPSAEPSTEPGKNPAGTTAPSTAPSTVSSQNPAGTTAPGSGDDDADIDIDDMQTGDIFTAGRIRYRIAGASNVQVLSASAKGKKAGKIVIPAKVKRGGKVYKVTKILKNAFKNCKKLKKITIGAKVTAIAKGAFSGCKKLKNITIKTKKLKKVAKKAFGKNAKKMKVYIPKSKYARIKKLLRGKGLPKNVKYIKK